MSCSPRRRFSIWIRRVGSQKNHTHSCKTSERACVHVVWSRRVELRTVVSARSGLGRARWRRGRCVASVAAAACTFFFSSVCYIRCVRDLTTAGGYIHAFVRSWQARKWVLGGFFFGLRSIGSCGYALRGIAFQRIVQETYAAGLELR